MDSTNDHIEGTMPTFVLIHAAATDSWYWHLLAGQLRAAGCEVIAVDLPVDDDRKDLTDYADVVVNAVERQEDLIVVGHSFGGFTAPLVAQRLSADLLVMLQAQIPSPGEAPGDWWENTGYTLIRQQQDEAESATSDDPLEFMLHDTPQALAEGALSHVREQSNTPFETPWPLSSWPEVPTRVLLSSGDQFFPLDFMQSVSRERLGIEPDVMQGDHCPMLGYPEDLASRLLKYHRSL